MEIARDDCRIPAVCGDVRARHENTRACRGWHLILALVCVLLLGAVSTSFAETTCGEPSTCVVIIDNYLPKPGYWVVQTNSIINVDKSCNSLGIIATNTFIEYIPWYDHTIIKYYWDGQYWQILGGGHAYTADIATGADYANDLSSNRSVYPQNIFPNGCSDLPSQQPDHSPNLDAGKPECPQIPLD